ncbi:MAG: class I SAM-dependent methyltransferase [Acidobacteria bacterium]|nr:MAG: class I SAM-dependent methyltransferase [Acidobacteriota bacterium]
MSESFYRSFSEADLTGFGARRHERSDRRRLALITEAFRPPGDLVEIGPGRGTFALAARAAGWRYRAIDASSVLVAALRAKGFDVTQSFVPPIPAEDESADVIHADQVLEHMPGIDAARSLASEALRVLRPGGVFSVVVPDYLKEKSFFWDVDYTHNFVTTDRRVRQLLHDGGFAVERAVPSIGAATGFARAALSFAGFLSQLPGTDGAARLLGLSTLLFQVRKNLFQTITFIARKPLK